MIFYGDRITRNEPKIHRVEEAPIFSIWQIGNKSTVHDKNSYRRGSIMIEEHIVRYVPRERIGLFIDGQYIFEAARSLNIHIDYEKFLKYFQTKGHVVRAFYYNAMLPGQEDAPCWDFYEWLDHNGYTTHIKQAREFIDENGVRKVKHGLEVDIVVDMIEMAPYLDHAVLCAGQGDLRRVVEAVQRKGLQVTVVSTVRAPTAMAAWELRRRADHFDDLFDLAPLITRDRRPAVHSVS
jgi:uncharacterized LabA/DUF88 family protein